MISTALPSTIFSFGRSLNVATHAVSSPFSSIVPSSVTTPNDVSMSSASYSVKVTFPPSGAVVLPSAFFHSFVTDTDVMPCSFLITPPGSTAVTGFAV